MTAAEEEEFITVRRQDLANILGMMVPDQRKRDVAVDHTLRLQRITKVLSSLGADSVKNIDAWLEMQERGDPGYMLIVISGEDTPQYVTHPEIGFKHEAVLTDETRERLGLNRKRMRRRKTQ